MVSQASFFAIYLTQKYNDYRTGYFDFGSAIQTAWLAANGHFDALALGRPITIVASFFFWLYPHAETLVGFQSCLIALGALPIFLLARDQLTNEWYAAGFAGLYLIFPALWGVNQYEYHDLALCIPFLAFSVYFYTIEKVGPYLCSLFLALSSSPFVVIIALALALSMLIDSYSRTRNLRLGRFPIATILSAFLFSVYLQIVPTMFSYQFATLGSGTYSFTGSTSYLNPASIFTDPLGSLGYAAPMKALYLASLFAPMLFLPSLALRRFLPGLPWLAVVVLYSPPLGAGGVGPVYQYSQWSSFIIPFIFVGGIYGYKRLLQANYFRGRPRFKGGHLLILMFVICISVSTVASGLSPLGRPQTFSTGDSSVPTDFNSTSIFHGIWPTAVQNSTILDWFVSQVPQNYSVLTQNPIGSKLWQRPAPVYIFFQPGYKNVNADAILIDTNVQGLCATCVDTIISSGNYVQYLSYPSGGIFLYFKIR